MSILAIAFLQVADVDNLGMCRPAKIDLLETPWPSTRKQVVGTPPGPTPCLPNSRENNQNRVDYEGHHPRSKPPRTATGKDNPAPAARCTVLAQSILRWRQQRGGVGKDGGGGDF
jgi:hypothetical protein